MGANHLGKERISRSALIYIGLYSFFLASSAPLTAEPIENAAFLAPETGAASSPHQAEHALLRSDQGYLSNQPSSVSGAVRSLLLQPPYRWEGAGQAKNKLFAGFALNLKEKQPQDEAVEFKISEIISEINRELKRRFGAERLFFELEKQTPSGSALIVEGAMIDSAGRPAADRVIVEAALNGKGKIFVSGLERIEVPAEDIESLMTQLASFPNPAISLNYALVQNAADSRENSVPASHAYVFKAEREGRHFLYLEKTILSPGGQEYEEKWVFPVIVGKTRAAETEGVISVKSGEFFSIEDLKRGASAGQEAAGYRWLTTSELLEWREEETQRARRQLEEIFSSVQMPAELQSEQLQEGAAFLEEVFDNVKAQLDSFRDKMSELGFVMEEAPAPEAMRKLEIWAAERLNGLYEKLMKTPVWTETPGGRLLVPMSELIDLIDLEIKQYYKARHNLKSNPALFPVLSPEIVSQWNSEEGSFHFNIFSKAPELNGSGPSTGDLRRLILSLLESRGNFVVSKGSVSPTLFSLVLHGVDERVRKMILELYQQEAGKNRKNAAGVKLLLREIKVTKATRDWPVTLLEAEVPYMVEGAGAHTAAIRAERSAAGYEIKVLSIGTPFTDEFLALTGNLLEKYLPSKLEAGELSALYHGHGGFRGASFAVNGRPYVAELVWGEEATVSDLLIFGDYTGDGVIDHKDYSKSRELMAGMDKNSTWFLSEVKEDDSGVYGLLFRNKEPVLHAWSHTAGGTLKPELLLSLDVTGDGVLFFDDLAFASAAMKDAEALAAVIVRGAEPDYDDNGIIDEKDAAYVYEVYERLNRVFTLLSPEEKEVLDINKDGKATLEDGGILKENTVSELARRRIQKDLEKLNAEALGALESILAIPSFPDQNLDGLLDPSDGVMAAKNLIILKVHVDRLKSLRKETSALANHFPDEARRLQETLAMLDDYIETASMTQDKLRGSLEEIRLGPPHLSSQELENAPPTLPGSLKGDFSLSKSPSR